MVSEKNIINLQWQASVSILLLLYITFRHMCNAWLCKLSNFGVRISFPSELSRWDIRGRVAGNTYLHRRTLQARNTIAESNLTNHYASQPKSLTILKNSLKDFLVYEPLNLFALEITIYGKTYGNILYNKSCR